MRKTSRISEITVREDSSFELRYKGNELKVAFIGCAGTGEGHQRTAGLGVAKVHPDFVIGLGDQFYNWLDDGISSPSQLRKQLIEPYQEVDTPFFLVEGNHEANIHSSHKRLGFKNFRQGLVNSANFRKFCTAEPPTNWPPNPHILLASDSTTQPKFNMATTSYYKVSCISETATIPDTEYLILNTNSLPYDQEQKNWLYQQLRDSKAKNIIICGHHPLMTYGKRRFKKTDGRMYANAMIHHGFDKATDQYRFYQAMYGYSHNDILKGVLKNEILKDPSVPKERIRAFFSAHDHMQMIIGGARYNQFIMGASGNKTNDATYSELGDAKNKIHYYSKAPGFCLLTSQSEIKSQTLTDILIENYTVNPKQQQSDPKLEARTIINARNIRTDHFSKKIRQVYITKRNPDEQKHEHKKFLTQDLKETASYSSLGKNPLNIALAQLNKTLQKLAKIAYPEFNAHTNEQKHDMRPDAIQISLRSLAEKSRSLLFQIKKTQVKNLHNRKCLVELTEIIERSNGILTIITNSPFNHSKQDIDTIFNSLSELQKNYGQNYPRLKKAVTLFCEAVILVCLVGLMSTLPTLPILLLTAAISLLTLYVTKKIYNSVGDKTKMKVNSFVSSARSLFGPKAQSPRISSFSQDESKSVSSASVTTSTHDSSVGSASTFAEL